MFLAILYAFSIVFFILAIVSRWYGSRKPIWGWIIGLSVPWFVATTAYHRTEDGTVDRRRDHKVLLPPARAEQERRGYGDRDAREVVGVAKGAKTAEGVRRVTQSGGRPEQIFRRND